MMDEIMKMLPKSICEMIQKYPFSLQEKIEEIRIRLLRPLEIIIAGKPYIESYHITHEDGIELLNKLSQFSLYTIEEELKRGYITIQGGHRVGLAGKVITENSQVKAIRDVASFNIRIARQKIGIANQLVPYLYEKHWLNTIIIGSPQTGKTTLLRDLARIISSGISGIPSSKVGIVDERSEIAGCVKGIPQHQFGPRLDVLDACPKAEGMMMMIRSMSPEVLIVDEIGRKEDSEAILEAIHAGVYLFMSVHGHELRDLYNRPSLKSLLEIGVFERFIELSREKGPGTVKRIVTKDGKNLFEQVGVARL